MEIIFYTITAMWIGVALLGVISKDKDYERNALLWAILFAIFAVSWKG